MGWIPNTGWLQDTWMEDNVARTELVTNGTFTDATGWTLGAGWSLGTNCVSHSSGGGTAALSPSSAITLSAGTKYKVMFTISGYASGSLRVIESANSDFDVTVSSDGQVAFYATATGDWDIDFNPTNTFTGSVGGVSVKEIL